jgi:hypothetical protein
MFIRFVKNICARDLRAQIFLTKRILLLGLFFFFNRHYLATLVMPAVGADRVRGAQLAAVRASRQVHSRQGVVCAAAVATTAGVFTFWVGGHSNLLI